MKGGNTAMGKDDMLGIRQWLLEVKKELQTIKASSKGNCDLTSVLDHLINGIDSQLKALSRGDPELTVKDLTDLLKILGAVVDIVKQWFNTLFYKLCRFIAKSHKYMEEQCQLEKLSKSLGLAEG